MSTIFEHADPDGDSLAVETAHGGGFAVIATDSDGEGQVVVYLKDEAAVALVDGLQAHLMRYPNATAS